MHAGPERRRAVEILRDREIERAAARLVPAANAPVGEHGHAPDVIFDLALFEVDALFAEHDRDLGFIVETIAAVGIGQFAIGSVELALQLPETPDAGLADGLGGIAFIGLAAHLDRHRRRRDRRNAAAAGAGRARVIGARRVQLQHRIGERAHDALAIRTQLVLRLAEQMIERLLRGVDRALAAFDQPREIRRRDPLGHFERVGLVLLLAQKFCNSVREVDDVAVVQHAGSLRGTEDDDFHDSLFLN